MIPKPSQERTVVGQEFGSSALDSVVPGLTTRTDLLERLGKPYTTLDRPHVLVYPWTTTGGSVLWAVGVGGGAAAGESPLHYHYTLLIALDETEHVAKVEITKRWDFDCVREHAYKWAQAKGLTGDHRREPFVLRAIPPGQSVLYVYRSGGFWDAPNVFIAAVILDKHQLLAELRSDEYASVVLDPGNYGIIVSPDAKNPASPYAQKVARIAVQMLPDQATFLRVRIPHGMGDVTPRLTLPPDDEAVKELTSRVTSW
jgi:hypothetical protein